jgi:hypothetical protein
MKRWLIVLMVAFFALSLVGAALAAGPKVPKILCYSFENGSEMSLLYLKSTGVIKTATGATKIYSVSGTHFNAGNTRSFPVSGSAYVVTTAGVSSLHFTYTGMQSIGIPNYDEFHAQGRIHDLTDLTVGRVDFGYMNLATGTSTKTGADFGVNFTLINPLTVTIPFSLGDADQMKAQ